MERNGTALIGAIDVRAVSNQEFYERSRRLRIPNAAGFRSRIAGIMQRRCPPPVLRVHICAVLYKQRCGVDLETSGRQMQRRVTDLNPMWNRSHKEVLLRARPRQVGRFR